MDWVGWAGWAGQMDKSGRGFCANFGLGACTVVPKLVHPLLAKSCSILFLSRSEDPLSSPSLLRKCGAVEMLPLELPLFKLNQEGEERRGECYACSYVVGTPW
jgi:hypothetical protein